MLEETKRRHSHIEQALENVLRETHVKADDTAHLVNAFYESSSMRELLEQTCNFMQVPRRPEDVGALISAILSIGYQTAEQVLFLENATPAIEELERMVMLVDPREEKKSVS